MSKLTGLSRNTIDKFYTRSATVELCMNLFRTTIQVHGDDLCIEPSAGDGAFAGSIKALFTEYRLYDIEPDSGEITKQDFLALDGAAQNSGGGKIHVLGNPPFGRQSSLAIKFIKHAARFADTISFILPKSFRKESMQKHFDLNFHLVSDIDLPKDSFTLGSDVHDVACVFQIWEKLPGRRVIPVRPTPVGFKFVRRDRDPDVAVRRVGVYAGCVYTNTEDRSIESHYFVKFDSEISADVLDKLRCINYPSKDYTVGPRSISKSEITREFNMIFTTALS